MRYPTDYQTTVNQGQREVTKGYQPEIKPLNVNVQDYEVIAVGTPTWWYTMAPAVLSFLNSQNWSNKVVIPFMTNGGSQLETATEEIDSWIANVVNYLKEGN